MHLAGINLSDFDTTTSILEALRTDDATDIDDRHTESGGEAVGGVLLVLTL